MPFKERKTVPMELLKEADPELYAAVRAVILRGQAAAVVPVTEEQIRKARAFLAGEKAEGPGGAVSQRNAFTQVAVKFIREDKRHMSQFMTFMGTLDGVAAEENKCDICGLGGWPSTASLQIHKMWHTRNRTMIECPVCGAKHGETSMNNHIKNMNDAAHREYVASLPATENEGKEE